MLWEQLTSADFARAVKETGVCVLTLGVVEKHGEHMPLGTDFLNGHREACLAAAIEPAVVFPPFYFGQIYEARCYPGTLTLPPTLLLDLLLNVLDEIGRNGFKKIILYNAHGGNNYLLPFLAQTTLWTEKPYSVYLYKGELGEERARQWQALLETDNHMHACECETSVTLANFPDLVHMERVPKEPAEPLGRMAQVPGAFAGISWYANYPEHYAGDARTASIEKGRALVKLTVEALAEFIARVKADEAAPALNAEFYARVRDLGKE
ncbi:MAG: creatininase family protein [Anaerolineaceae bacterium]|nr:creatininase family protein [Anaerolineaceae bacterium]